MSLAKKEFKTFKLVGEEGITHLRFCQPEKANAMTRDFWREFPQALSDIESDKDSRVLLITGEGKHFSSGMDLSVFSDNNNLSNGTARERERLRRLIIDLQSVFSKLEQLQIPVVAAVQGACIGGALDLISACDIRYASKQAYFCIQEINLAMMADLGVLQRLPKLIPDGVVRELAFTGDRLQAERALQLGLLNNVFETEDEMLIEAKAVCKKISAKSPLAIAASKESLNFARDNSVPSSLAHAAILQSSLLDISDLSNAARSAAQKAEASFDSLLLSAKL